MIDGLTPTERSAAMNAMPTHLVYMTHGGGYAKITQSYCRVIDETDDMVTIESVSGVLAIPRGDVFARKEDHVRLTSEEMDAVFAEHGSKQRRP